MWKMVFEIEFKFTYTIHFYRPNIVDEIHAPYTIS